MLNSPEGNSSCSRFRHCCHSEAVTIHSMSHAESKTVHSTFLPPGSPDRRAGSSQIWGLTFTPSVNKAATADRLSTKYPQKSLKGGQITRSWHTGAKWRDSLQIEGVNSQNPFVFQQQQYDNTHVINRVTHCCHHRPGPLRQTGSGSRHGSTRSMACQPADDRYNAWPRSTRGSRG